LNQVKTETIPALREIQAAGKCRYIGITGFPLKIFEEVTKKTEVDCILSYGHYSLNNTALLKLIPNLETKGIGVISAAALSQGLLTEKGTPDWHAASPELREACKKAFELCVSSGASLPKLALQFAYANEHISSTLVGIASSEELEKNIRWLFEPLDQDLLKKVLQILEPVHNQVWPSGKPENN